MEAAVSEKAAAALGVGMGSRLQLADAATPLADPSKVTADVQIVGIWRPNQRGDAYWLGDSLDLDGAAVSSIYDARTADGGPEGPARFRHAGRRRPALASAAARVGHHAPAHRQPARGHLRRSRRARRSVAGRSQAGRSTQTSPRPRHDRSIGRGQPSGRRPGNPPVRAAGRLCRAVGGRSARRAPAAGSRALPRAWRAGPPGWCARHSRVAGHRHTGGDRGALRRAAGGELHRQPGRGGRGRHHLGPVAVGDRCCWSRSWRPSPASPS